MWLVSLPWMSAFKLSGPIYTQYDCFPGGGELTELCLQKGEWFDYTCMFFCDFIMAVPQIWSKYFFLRPFCDFFLKGICISTGTELSKMLEF